MKHRPFLTPLDENFIHSFGVGCVAYYLGEHFNVSPLECFIAGCLHDLGGAVPTQKRIDVAHDMGISLCKEEIQCPLLIHDKLGYYFSKYYFKVHNERINKAILYHTTCIDNASNIEKIVFIADKLQWDRNGIPPYFEELKSKLSDSLNEGCAFFVNWLYNDPKIYVRHPFLKRSYQYFCEEADIENVPFVVENVRIEKNIIKNYYLREIRELFYSSFKDGLNAEKGYNMSLDFVAGTLTHLLDTIPDSKLTNIIRGFNADLNVCKNKRYEAIVTVLREEYHLNDQLLEKRIGMKMG